MRNINLLSAIQEKELPASYRKGVALIGVQPIRVTQSQEATPRDFS